MNLRPGEVELLAKIRLADAAGLLWSKYSSTIAARLLRMGLIEYRLGSVAESEGGGRTGMRYVAVNHRQQVWPALTARCRVRG